jgi:hypothetical protein
MKNRTHYHYCVQHLSVLVRLVLIAAICAAAGLAGRAWAADEGWPRQKQLDGNTLVIYQPQLDSWKDQKVLKARVAVTITLQGQKQPISGAVWITADTATDLENRVVIVSDLEIEQARFSVLDETIAKTAEKIVKSSLTQSPMQVSLDRILAGLKQTEEMAAKNIPLKNDPPKIFVSFEPARILIFDGQPVFAPVEGTNLQYAINTNWTVFNETATSSYFLLDGTTWLTTNKLGDPWMLAKSLPGDLSRLPADDNFKDARVNVPPKQPSYSKIPKVIMVTEPAELIVIDGKPKYQAIGSGGLHYVSNTDADLFYYDGDQSWYFLVAGRWYRTAKALDKAWTFATADLPKAFASIPPKSPKGRVLYSVPGTPQSQEAVLVAGIPQSATVKPNEVKLTVTYSGDPVFEPITGTTPQLFYAKNTSFTVIKVNDESYYACERGVWFTAVSPAGPWVVATAVPQVIYTIPPSSPVYPVTYVVQTSPSPDVVIVNYYPGYTGCYVSYGVVFWGTGYYYPPYYHPAPMPIYYPHPYTYGAHAWYHPATNTYYRGGAAYGPYGGYGAGASYNATTGTYKRGYGAYGPSGGYKVGQAYNPSTGAYATGAAAYGPNGSVRAAQGYNPSTGTRAAGAQGSSVYGSWGAGVVSKGDQWVKGGYASTGQGTVGGIKTSEGGGMIKGQNNTYVGKDGNVYRKGESGSWQKYENGSWSGVDKGKAQAPSQLPAQSPSREPGSGGDRAGKNVPSTGDRQQNVAAQPGTGSGNRAAVMGDLNRESANRAAGQQRANEWNSQQSARSSAQTARPAPSAGAMPRGGGGMRGGGGGRR